MNVEFHCLENSTSFGHVYGPQGFYGKGGTICYTIHRLLGQGHIDCML